MFDLIELYTHWHAGRSRRQFAASLGIDRKTIAKYLQPAIDESFTPGTGPVTEAAWSEHIARWFPEVADPGQRATTWPQITPHWERIGAWLGADVTVAAVAQRFGDDYDVAASESSVRRWIATHFAEEVAREKVTVTRGAVDPGSEAQIDYGKLGCGWIPTAADASRSGRS